MDIILLKVKGNPVLYLGKPSLKLLDAFISGYLICRDQINGKNSLEFYPGLEKSILQKYHIKIPTSYDSSRVIRFNTFNEEQAFYKFFELLEEFKAKQNDKTSYFITDLCVSEEEVMAIMDKIVLKIKERPGLYLGIPSLEQLNVFINGCLAYINQINRDRSFEFYPGFQEFVVQKYDIKIAAHWSKVINFVTVSDKEAIYRFFELLEEFKANQKKI